MTLLRNESTQIKITFIFAESSLELIPEELLNHPLIIKYALKRKKTPRTLLLDSTYHFKALMHSKIKNKEKRGRPDIIHRMLLITLDSLLNRYGFLEIYVHTIDDRIIWVNPKVRIPRHYARFVGLMEKLLTNRVIRVGDNPKEILLKVLPLTFEDLLKKLTPYITLGFSKKGQIIENFDAYIAEIINKVTLKNKTMLGNARIVNIIGGFPKGSFSKRVLEKIDLLLSLSPLSLSAQYVICRIIAAYERVLIPYTKLNNKVGKKD